MNKFTKDGRRAIIWQVKEQILQEDEAKKAELYANYKPSAVYSRTEELLTKAKNCLDEARSLTTASNKGFFYCGRIDLQDIDATLKSIKNKEINFKYRTVDRDALENKLILMTIKEDVDVETIISELVASIE